MIRVTCAIIVKDRKILVVQNGSDSDHPFQWEFPGGKIKGDETSAVCIKREIKEELEIGIRIIKKMCAVKWDYGFKEIELIPFLSIIESGEIKLTEHIQLLWKDFESLGELDLSEADKGLINLYDNREILEEYFRENMHDS